MKTPQATRSFTRISFYLFTSFSRALSLSLSFLSRRPTVFFTAEIPAASQAAVRSSVHFQQPAARRPDRVHVQRRESGRPQSHQVQVTAARRNTCLHTNAHRLVPHATVFFYGSIARAGFRVRIVIISSSLFSSIIPVRVGSAARQLLQSPPHRQKIFRVRRNPRFSI